MRILNVWLAADNRKTKRLELKKFTPKVNYICPYMHYQLFAKTFAGTWNEIDIQRT
jgi:hypothetical protein